MRKKLPHGTLYRARIIGDLMVKPHYTDIVEESELGKKLADVMTRAFYDLVRINL